MIKNKKEIVIYKNTSVCTKYEKAVSFEELKILLRNGDIFRRIFQYRSARLITQNNALITKPLITAVLLKCLAPLNAVIIDESGERIIVNARLLINLVIRFFKEYFCVRKELRSILHDIKKLKRCSLLCSKRSLMLQKSPLYLRTDLWFGVRSGGSVGHIAGVLNNLDSFTEAPIFLTTDNIPTVREDIHTRLIIPDNVYWDFSVIPTFVFNKKFCMVADDTLSDSDISFVYQRYSLNNFSGVKLAMDHKVPFVLEYNGSEIWINRNWGKPLKYEGLSEQIELLNLEVADVIVVVSQPMKDELVARNINPDKILVNPNGVDPMRYSPEVDGSAIRQRYRLKGKTVIGFIGTFGKWHGAEVLAEAYGRLLQTFPEYRRSTHLFMIGDGQTMPQVRERLEFYGVRDHCDLAGLIPQQEGPEHLAACDILASPHVPNADGTPFFGSPTKLFEYMAMGKGIVASDLDQIGEILDHDRTAWLVKPGDPEAFMLGLKTLIDDGKLRNRLGEAARQDVVVHYTWKEHTRRIMKKLKERCS